VTSVAIGNCGFGFAPARPEVRERLLRMMTRTEQIPYESMVEGMGLDWDWETCRSGWITSSACPRASTC
jgi:N-acyl-D-amino-acid deacylase